MVFMMWIAFVCTAVVVRKEENAALSAPEERHITQYKVTKGTQKTVGGGRSCRDYCITCKNGASVYVARGWTNRQLVEYLGENTVVAAAAVGTSVITGGLSLPAGIAASTAIEMHHQRKCTDIAIMRLEGDHWLMKDSSELRSSCDAFKKGFILGGHSKLTEEKQICLKDQDFCGGQGAREVSAAWNQKGWERKDGVEIEIFENGLRQKCSAMRKSEAELKCCCADGDNNGAFNGIRKPFRKLDTQAKCEKYAEDVQESDWIPNVGTGGTGRCCTKQRVCFSSDFPNVRDYCETADTL